jgi:O-antigen ligase
MVKGAVGKESPVATNWPLLLLIVFIPWQNIYLGKIPSLGAGLNFMNVMVLASLLVWRTRKDLAIPTPNEIGKPLLGFMAILLFSGFFRSVTLGRFEIWVFQSLKDYFIPMLIFFIVLNSVRDRRGIFRVIVATLVPLVYMFHVFRDQYSSVAHMRYSDDLRLARGTFMQLGSNEMAAFYATYTFVLIGLMIFIKNTKARVVLGFLVALNTYCLLYSHSRGAYLGALLGIGALVWFRKRGLIFIILPLVIVFSGALVGFFPESVQERFGMIFADDSGQRDESAASRPELWGYAVGEFMKSPVFGRGYLTFIHNNPMHKDTHNYYVKILAEQGLIGIWLLLLILARAFKACRGLYEEADDPLYKALGLGMTACMVSMLFGNVVGDRFSHYPLITYFWVYLALVLRARMLIKVENLNDASALSPASVKYGRIAGP